MTIKELIRYLKQMPQNKRVYIYYESCDCDIMPNDIVYDGEEVCLWSDTGEINYAIPNNKNFGEENRRE